MLVRHNVVYHNRCRSYRAICRIQSYWTMPSLTVRTPLSGNELAFAASNIVEKALLLGLLSEYDLG
jgi:hypothetical protein